MTETRRYRALVLDLDGTLVDDRGRIHPRTAESLRRAREAGVHVMVATGRSELGALPVLEELELDTPTLVYNGAGLYCPSTGRMLEERLLSDRTVARTLALSDERGYYPVVQVFRAKYTYPSGTEAERAAVAFMEGLELVPRPELPVENVLRITLFDAAGNDSAAFEDDVRRGVDQPIYTTHFPLAALAEHRDSGLLVVDVQPPCRGKGEALRILEESFGIPPAEVVAVGDAGNDVPMLEAAGLGVSMERGILGALEAADRVIGDNNTDALGALVEELFLEGSPSTGPASG